jgi:hypothetical protein
MNTETSSTSGKSFSRYLPHAARLLLGLGFTVFGLNGFFQFMGGEEQMKAMPDTVKVFMFGMVQTGYMMQLIAGTQLVSGVLLLLNRFVPLALTLLAPVLVNIVALHAFLEPAGIAPGLVFCALEIYLAWSYRHAFRPMLAARVTPGGQ